MPTIQQLSIYSLAALASYATGLAPNADNTAAYMDDKVNMSASQAANFEASWAVLQQFTSINGFSAVLLQRKDSAGNATGEKVLAIAGTSSPVDWATDLVNIAILGTVIGMPQYASLDSFYAQLVSTGKLGASEQVVVAGHSLGGFLAQAFTTRHSSVVSAAYTYNAPGFSSIETLLGFFGVTDASAASKITNVHAADGESFTAGLGSLLGVSVPVRIEADALNANNHSMVRLGDSLAVQDMFARLDPSVTVSTANTFIQVGSNLHDTTLESVLDAVRRLVMGPSTAATGNGDRNALYINLKTLTDSAAFDAIAGKVSIAASGVGLAATARTDFASLLSLLTLSPVALKATVGNETAVESALKPAWNAVHTDWQADKDMTQAERDSGKETYTAQYLADRSAMLGWVVTRNQLDVGATEPVHAGLGAQGMHFKDVQSAIELDIGLPDSIVIKRQTQFGSDANETINGKSLSDRLYGGAGNDSLNGLEGADHIEGNAGDDSLDGGSGASNDTLYGGAGADLYIVGTKAGVDVIASSDTDDRLQLGGRTLNGSGTFLSSVSGITQWRDSSLTTDVINYQLNASSKDLFITGAHSTVRVKDFVSGDLGLAVPGAPPAAPPPPTTSFKDFSVAAAVPSASWHDTVTPGLADHLVNFNAWYVPGHADLLNLSSRAGNDWIEGGSGANTNLKLIKAGSGDDADTIAGGAGRDVIQLHVLTRAVNDVQFREAA